MQARCSAEEKQKVINRYFVDKEFVNTIASETGIPCGTIYSWIEQHKQKYFENSTEKHIDLSTLPRRTYGKELHIEWSKSVGHKLPFVYGHITGELEILEHHKGNYIVVCFQNKSKKLRTNALMDMKITDLVFLPRTKTPKPKHKGS